MSDTTLRLKLEKLPAAVMRLSVSTLTQKLIKFVNAHRHIDNTVNNYFTTDSV